MTYLSDDILVARSLAGDAQAFMVLARRYRGPLSSLIRFRVGSPDDAQDVMQETLLAAWSGLPRLREPQRFRPWLLQVARNRCRDFLKSTHRRDEPTEGRLLEGLVNRAGRAVAADRACVAAAEEALGEIPGPPGEAARLFYLDGLTITQVASETHSPEGTVKRRLHDARAQIREALGVSKVGKEPMTARTPRRHLPPVPPLRPEIAIVESDAAPFAVDCPELRWWGIVPEVGQTASWATYSPPGWEMNEYTDMRAVGEGKAHGTPCVNIEVTTWDNERGWESHGVRRIFGRLTEDKAQYLAILYEDAALQLQTYLDEGFDWAWGEMDRRIEDRGRFVRQPDGSWRQAHGVGDCSAFAAGVCQVRIGEGGFECLRVFQIEGALDDDHTAIIEGYFTREGRNVLNRHYCRPGARKEPLDESTALVIDGERFVHWYDSLTHLALPG